MTLERITPPEERERLARRHLAQREALRWTGLRWRVRRWGLRALGPLITARARPASRTAARFLVIRPDHLGDLLFITPALARLRQLHPDAHITAMVGPWGRAILKDNPDIDALILCPFPGFTRRPKASPWEPYRVLLDYAVILRAGGFDQAFLLRFDHWWGALLAAWAGIPRRVGYDTPETRPFLTRAHPHRPDAHAVLQNLHLVDPELVSARPASHPLRFRPTVLDELWAEELVRALATEAGPLVAIHPGAGAPVKAWRPLAWARVADALIQRHGARVVLTGGPQERALAERIAAAMRHPARILAGQTTLGRLGALMARCALVMGPDSGPLHLAVAVGTPTVHLFGPADPRLFGPWGDPRRHRVLTSDWACIPCNRLDYPTDALPEHGCVRDIPEDAVLAAASELLGG